MPTTNDQKQLQFTLKWLLVVTAIAALIALAFKIESEAPFLLAYAVSCFAVATTGRDRRSCAIRGAIAGAIVPAGLLACGVLYLFVVEPDAKLLTLLVLAVPVAALYGGIFGGFIGMFAIRDHSE